MIRRVAIGVFLAAFFDWGSSSWRGGPPSLQSSPRANLAFLPSWSPREKLSQRLDIARHATPSQADNRLLADTQ